MPAEPELHRYADALLRCSVNEIDQITNEIRHASEALASLDLDEMEARLDSCQRMCVRLLDETRLNESDPASHAQRVRERGAALRRLRGAALVHAALLRRSRSWVATCENLMYGNEIEYSGTRARAIHVGS